MTAPRHRRKQQGFATEHTENQMTMSFLCGSVFSVAKTNLSDGQPPASRCSSRTVSPSARSVF